MKVILTTNIKKLGKIGDLVEVKNGFARNFLFPNNMALRDSKKNLEYYNNIKEELDRLLKEKIPTFGICLGHQILSLAFNAETMRMDKGHRVGNHPVKNLKNNTVEITSQNHGFVVSDRNFPKDLEITHISLFDGTVDGMKSKNQPLFSVQYHPESSPGPHDSRYLFDEFINLMNTNAR